MARQVYCGICGGPMLDSGPRTDKPTWWLQDAILLTTVHKVADGIELDEYFPGNRGYPYTLGPSIPAENERSVIQVKVTTHDQGTTFRLATTGQYITPFFVDIPAKPGGYTKGGPLYVILHEVCLDLASRFIDSVNTTGQMPEQIEDRITSVRHLWEVLYQRIPGEKGEPSEMEIPEPHEYFGGRQCRGLYWEPDDDKALGEIHEANPIELADLTTSLLENLKPIQNAHKTHHTTSQSPLGLAHNFQALSLDCEYIQSPSWWCKALLNKEIFPWLWDLDVEVVRDKQAKCEWDWELLVRQLSQVEIHEPGNQLMDIPVQLKNRRRIWLLLEEARVGDIAVVEEERIRALIAEDEPK